MTNNEMPQTRPTIVKTVPEIKSRREVTPLPPLPNWDRSPGGH